MLFRSPPVSLHLLLIATVGGATAQSLASCSPSATPTDDIRPSVASGYQAALVATGLNRPRSLQFDSAGNLLVVQSGRGIESLQLQDNGGACVSVRGRRTVIQAQSVSNTKCTDGALGCADLQHSSIMVWHCPQMARHSTHQAKTLLIPGTMIRHSHQSLIPTEH